MKPWSSLPSRRPAVRTSTPLWTATILALALILLVSATWYAQGDDLLPVEFRQSPLPQEVPRGEASRLLAADGSVLATFYLEQREAISLERVPVLMQYALIATEDRRFYSHRGIDLKAFLRALRQNVQAGEVHQGGSTITQQYVKNLYFPTEPRTPQQKAKEAFLASRIERQMSKEAILEAYLNTAYFGNGAVGLQAASRNYFGKDADSLDLAESALLAGIARAPESYNPRLYPWLAIKRRNLVLEQMVREGYVDRNTAEAAKRRALHLAPLATGGAVRYPYFVEFVRQALLADPHLGPDRETRAAYLYRAGLTIKTTLRPELQDLAESVAAAALPYESDPDVALVSIDVETGDVLALVGGKDFSKSQFNLATDGRRQPGSTFKVFALVAALRNRIPPQLLLDGSPKTLVLPTGEIWRVTNYEGGGGGIVSLWEATVHSINGAYADLAMRLGPAAIVSAAYDMGIGTELDANPSVVLGGVRNGVSPYEMAVAFATLASGGSRVDPRPIESVEGPSIGRIEYPSVKSLVLDSGVAWQANQILQDVVRRGTGRRAFLGGIAVAGKTGTTEGHVDAWFVGYTPRISTAVWVGYKEGSIPMTSVHGVRVAGGNIPAGIWHAYMSRAASVIASPPSFPEIGEGLESVWIDPDTGRIAGDYCENRMLVRLPSSIVPLERQDCEAPVSATDTAAPQTSESTPTAQSGPPVFPPTTPLPFPSATLPAPRPSAT